MKRNTVIQRWTALLAGISIGCTPTQPQQSAADPTPFYSISEGGVSHLIYRNTPFDAVAATLESGSVDSIHYDTTFESYCVAVVDIDLAYTQAQHFRTSFHRSDGTQHHVDWRLAEGKSAGTGRGVFIIPGDTTAARTSFTEAHD